MSEIITSVQELENITKEIKRLSGQIKALKKRKKEIEVDILTFLNTREQPGLKYKNIAVISKDKNMRESKTKNNRLSDGKYILEKYGIRNSESVLNEVINAMKGNEQSIKCLKIQNIKRK